MAQRTEPVRLSFEAGLDTRSPTTRMPPGSARIATNVDIHRDGLTVRRSGITLVLSLTQGHSGWSHPDLSYALAVENGDLIRISPDVTKTVLLSDVGHWPMRYCVHADRVYASNGIDLIRVQDVATRLVDASQALPPEYTAKEPVRLLPAGFHIASYHGRLFTAIGNTLRYSEPFYPEHHRMRTGFVLLEQPITGLGATEDGLYIGLSDCVVFAAGPDPSAWSRILASGKGLVEGTLTFVRSDWFGGGGYAGGGFEARGIVPCWRNTDDQLCVGRPGGVVQMPNADRIRRARPEGGVSVPVERDGLKQVLSMLWGPSPSEGIGFSDTWEAEVVSHNHTSGNP